MRGCGLSCDPKRRRPDISRSTCQRIVCAVCPLRPSRQRRAPDRRANPRRPEGHRALSPSAIRTYSSTGGAELVPPIAAEFGLKVTVGAWIGKNQERNEREIRSAIDLARHNSNVNADCGRQRDDSTAANMTIDQLISLIKRVKQSSPVPVTTGEIGSRLARSSRSWHRRSISSPLTSCPIGTASPRPQAVDQHLGIL